MVLVLVCGGGVRTLLGGEGTVLKVLVLRGVTGTTTRGSFKLLPMVLALGGDARRVLPFTKIGFEDGGEGESEDV